MQVQVSKEENAERRARPTPVPQIVEPQYQQQQPYRHEEQHYQHHEHRHKQHQHPQQDAPSIPRPTDVPSPETRTDLSPRQTVERLTHKLSKQKLQLSRSSRGQLQQPTAALLSPSAAGVENPQLHSFQAWAEREANAQQQHPLPSPSGVYTSPWMSIPTLDVGEPIEVDETYLEKPDDRRLLDVRRPRRQTSGQLRGSSTVRPVNPRVEGLIATGTQCTVRSESPSSPASPSPAPNPAMVPQPPFIEADPDCAMPTPLEVDDANGISDLPRDLMDFAEGGMPLRHASVPGGIRKYTVGGVALRYRLSADAALRCPNVVRSRPRMRKRTKTRHGSNASSAVTSTVNSPVLSSTSSPPMPPTHLSP